MNVEILAGNLDLGALSTRVGTEAAGVGERTIIEDYMSAGENPRANPCPFPQYTVSNTDLIQMCVFKSGHTLNKSF